MEFKQVHKNEFEVVLQLLKGAANRLQENNIDQWSHWLNPSAADIDWLKEGLDNGEFYFIRLGDQNLGMFRLSSKDLLYWGDEAEQAKYIHSFVIKRSYARKKIGFKVIELIGQMALKEKVFLLRLDCVSANKKLCNYYEQQGFSFVREKTLDNAKFNLYQKRLEK